LRSQPIRIRMRPSAALDPSLWPQRSEHPHATRSRRGARRALPPGQRARTATKLRSSATPGGCRWEAPTGGRRRPSQLAQPAPRSR
jgi:hypothetical protein